MIDNSLAKLLDNIEPKILNIEENRIELKSLKSVQKTMDELIDNAKESYHEILNFYDQDFIKRAIMINHSNYDEIIQKYDSSKYLLNIVNPNLKELPQYQEALSFMDYLYKYLYGLKESIDVDFECKREKLEVQELLNKYYVILKKDNFFIKDIDDFLTFIELNNLNNQDRINIYKLVFNSNVKQYLKTSEILFDDGINIDNIENLINDNQDLLKENYVETDDIKLKLDDYLKLISRIDEKSIDNRKIYLIHKIKENFELKHYTETINYYKDFLKIQKLQIEFNKQKVKPRRLLFTYQDDKSLVRSFLESVDERLRNCVLKNLLDIENENILTIPKRKYNDIYLYVKDEYVVKTVYSYLDSGEILIFGVLNIGEKLNDFIEKYDSLFRKTLNNIETIDLIDNERDLLLNNKNIEDLMLNIDLDTLDIKREDKYAR